jgi:hypothetical protein
MGDRQRRSGGVRDPAGPDRLPGLLFVSAPEPRGSRIGFISTSRPDHRDAEVARLLALAATRADVGQGEQSCVVL